MKIRRKQHLSISKVTSNKFRKLFAGLKILNYLSKSLMSILKSCIITGEELNCAMVNI